MFLELINNTAEIVYKKIVVEHRNLSKTLEEPLWLDHVAANDLQQLLGRLSDLCIKKILENITRYYRNKGNRVTEILHLCSVTSRSIS